MKGTSHVNFLETDNSRCCIEDCSPLGCNTIVWVVGNISKGCTVFTFGGEAQWAASHPKRLDCLAALLWEFNGMMQIAWPSCNIHVKKKSKLALAGIFISFLSWLYRQIWCSYTEPRLPIQNMTWQSWHQHSVWMSCNLVNCMWIIGTVL